MRRHILLIICVSLLSTLLYGCSSNTQKTIQYDTPLYSITVKDSNYNLAPKTPLSDADACIRLIYPEFQSIGEMRQGIMKGSFTEQELYAVSCTSPSKDGGIEICDLDHLYEFTAPNEFLLKKIRWCGKSYDCDLTSENVRGGIFCYNEEEYTEKLDNGYKNFLSNPLETLIKQEEIDERSATVYYCNTSCAELKYICYEIRVGNKKMFIQEEYVLKIDGDTQKVSSDVPATIHLWGEEHSGYFYGVFFDFTERPSVEWLSEFGITPYKGQENRPSAVE